MRRELPRLIDEGAPEKPSFEKAKVSTKGIYDRSAAWWHNQRLRTLYEKIWLDRFEQYLPTQGALLDLGCGTGEPIARYFMEKGYSITGVDYAPAMTEIARTNLLDATWVTQDMTKLDVKGPYAGIYSWDAFFHLDLSAQKALLPRLAALLAPKGALLLTVGDQNGEVLGTVAGEQVYHASLAPEEYQQILTDNGCVNFTFKAADTECMGRSVVLASKN